MRTYCKFGDIFSVLSHFKINFLMRYFIFKVAKNAYIATNFDDAGCKGVKIKSSL